MQSDSMKILITGANGNLGQQLIQRLCDEPMDANSGAFGVRALVRSERAAKAIRDLGCRILQRSWWGITQTPSP